MEDREFTETCREPWTEQFYYLYIDMTTDRKEGKYRIFNESKNTYFENLCKSEAFYFFKCCFQLKVDFEKSEELASLQNKVKEVRLQGN